MNKRARLTRRMLRDHRKRPWMGVHVSQDFSAKAMSVWSFWRCAHCANQSELIPLEAPRAYR